MWCWGGNSFRTAKFHLHLFVYYGMLLSMRQVPSVIALVFVLLTLACGVLGWWFQIEVLQVAFFFAAILLLGSLGVAGKTYSNWHIFRTYHQIINKKEFEKLTSSTKDWTLQNYRLMYLGYGIVASFVGVALLSIYRATDALPALLFGTGFLCSGPSSLLVGSVFRESDIVRDPAHRARVLGRSRWFLLGLPILVIAATFAISLSGYPVEDPMLLMFGVVACVLGVVQLPWALFKVARSLFRS